MAGGARTAGEADPILYIKVNYCTCSYNLLLVIMTDRHKISNIQLHCKLNYYGCIIKTKNVCWASL